MVKCCSQRGEGENLTRRGLSVNVPESVNATAGKSTTIPCSYKDDKEGDMFEMSHGVYWTRTFANGSTEVLLNMTRSYLIFGKWYDRATIVNQASLEIYVVTSQDAGKYTCVVEGKRGTAELIVDRTPHIQTESQELTLNEGQTLELTCIGVGTLGWRWPRHDEQYAKVSHYDNLSPSLRRSVLQIQRASPLDTGEYLCTSSSDGDDEEKWTSVPVYIYIVQPDGPLFLDVDQTNLVHFWDETSLIPCRLATPDATITLHPQEKFITGDGTTPAQAAAYDPRRGFVIQPELPDYGGNVSCRAILGNRTEWQNFRVNDVVQPKLSVESSEKVISQDSDLELTCSGLQPIRWFTPSGLGDRLQINHTQAYLPSQPALYKSTLRLSGALSRDTGEFACKYQRYAELDRPELKSSVYVFVNSTDLEDFFLPSDVDVIYLENHTSPFTVPCRVSNPRPGDPVRLYAFYTETFTPVRDFVSQRTVTFDPKVGFWVDTKKKLTPKVKIWCVLGEISQNHYVSFKVLVEGETQDNFQTEIRPSASRLVQGEGPFSLTCLVNIPILASPFTLDIQPQAEFTFPGQEQDWQKDNARVESKHPKVDFEASTVISEHILTLQNVSLENSGIFKCRLFNVEQSKTLNASLRVLEEGIVDLTPYPPGQSMVEEVEGQDEVCLRAQIKSYPVAQYWWSKNGVNQSQEAAPRFTVLEDPQPADDSLIISGCISNVTAEDGGLYEVVAVNQYHTRKLTLQLSVLEIPEVNLTVTPAPTYQDPPLYFTEQNYSLVCQGRGHPAPLLSWEWRSCTSELCNHLGELTDDNQWIPVGAGAQSWAQAGDLSALASERSTTSVLSLGRVPQSGIFRCVGRSPSDQIQDVVYDTLEYRLTDLKFSLPAVQEVKTVYNFDQASLACKTNIYAFAEDAAWDWIPADNATSSEPIPISSDDERVTALGQTGFHYTSELTISRALANNTGVYRCWAQKRRTNESVVVYEVQLNVKEIVLPRFITELQRTYTLDRKKTIPFDFVLECRARGDPLPELAWSKDGRPITADNSTVTNIETGLVTNNTVASKLYLSPEVTPAHGGMYVCRVENKGGSALSAGELLIQESPTATISEEVYTHNIGDNLTIPCIITGEPAPEISWKWQPHEGNQLEDVPAKRYDNDARALVFKRLAEADNGEYTCVARNDHGEARDTVTLVIHRDNALLVPLLAGGIIAGIIFLILVLGIIAMAKRNFRLARKAKRNSANMELGLVNPRSPRGPASPFRMSFKEEFGDQLPFDPRWEFPRDRLKLGSVIGQGAFGMVLKGVAAGINKNERYVPVAVKTVKSDCSYVDRKALFGELKMLIQVGHHLNVVNFLGACTQDSPPLVIVEYCPYGNLSDYLRSKRDTFQAVKPAKSEAEENQENELNYADLLLREACVSEPPAAEYELVDKEAKRMAEKPLSVEDLVCYCFQVARGMEFLASRKCIHRDLAARNVLLGGNNVVKICDFGLSRSFYHDTDYIGSGKGLLPIKWMAPEAIFDKIFTTYSDIWSFGVFTWEVFSLGGSPYPGVQVDEKFYDKMKAGYRMSCPEHAPREVYNLMLECWSDEPKDRPMFSELAGQFGELLESNTRQEYIDLNIPYQEGQYCELDFGKLSINRKPDTIKEETETPQKPSDGKTTQDAADDHFGDPTYHRVPRDGEKDHTEGAAPQTEEGGNEPPSTEILGEASLMHRYSAGPGSQGPSKPQVQLPDSLPEDPYKGGTDEPLHTYTSVKGTRPGLSSDNVAGSGFARDAGKGRVDDLPSPDDNKLHTYASIKGSRPDKSAPSDPDKGLEGNHLYSSIKGGRPNVTLDATPKVKDQDGCTDPPEEETSLLGRPKLPARDCQSMSLGRLSDGKLGLQKPPLPKRDFSTLSWSPEKETLLSGPKSKDTDPRSVHV
ncbi:vascular endothelial growth factor receptor 1-like isoform X2 [Acanthaster planci]|uniref:receptor protein-tyrosine kinase n=1 Tax=Acanthaster planci TaxID=133434 RepID=A0A8B7YZV0_ACAPL|nr:vascular endothelial growth factor receptor 1-like isoform X2 [Acanthaster planci]